MTRKNRSRFRMTSQVPEAKKSWIPLNVLAITAEFFRSDTPRGTRARRSPPARTPRTQGRSACRQRSASYALILGEIGEQVKGARDEHRPTRAEGPRQRLRGLLDGLDVAEVRPGPLGQVGRRQRPLVARRRGHERVAERRQ